MAFYFAARGEGYELQTNGNRNLYITPAKVFFSGLGADEQLGYIRLQSLLTQAATPVMQQPGKVQTVTGTQYSTRYISQKPFLLIEVGLRSYSFTVSEFRS